MAGGWLRSVATDRSKRPDLQTLKADALPSVAGAVGRMPDGMASGVLAGVSPIYGLYSAIGGAIGGGLTVSTRLMIVTTTSAAALAAGSAVSSVPESSRPQALALLTLCAAILMIVAGILRFGRYTRFVSHSVMTGFLTGVAVNIILGQLASLTGAKVSGSFALAKAIDLVLHPGRIQLASLAVGVSALLILTVANRTPARNFAALLALILPTVVVLLLGDTSVARVSDTGTIPSGLPPLSIPPLRLLTPSVMEGALAVAAIILVQGAGVRESVSSPTEPPSSVNQDFIGQGVGSALAGLMRGQPVGGSVGQTALSVAAGAKSRWASVMSGIWLLLIVVALSGVVGKVAMPTLAAILIYAAIGAIERSQITTIMRAGSLSRIALIVTFGSTLLFGVAAAVAVGVVLSLVLQMNRAAVDLRVTELTLSDDGERLLEGAAPHHPHSNDVTMLDVHGSLLFAGARTLQARLPDPAGTTRPAVVIRLRGHVSVGVTFAVVISEYSDRLKAVGGRLFLSGTDPELLARLSRTDTARERGSDAEVDITVLPAEPEIGKSTRHAHHVARSWLDSQRETNRAG